MVSRVGREKKKNNPRRHNNDLITGISLADTSECPAQLIFHKTCLYIYVYVCVYTVYVYKKKGKQQQGKHDLINTVQKC